MNSFFSKNLTRIFYNCRNKLSFTILTCFFFSLFNNNLQAQGSQKQVIDQYQTWVSMNTMMRFSNKWGIMSDVHVRTNHFFSNASFYLVRIGGVYWLTNSTNLAAGYTRIWVTPTQQGFHQNSDGNWLYEQIQHSGKIGKVNFTGRLRNEQRWQQRVVNDTLDGTIFSDRVRLLALCTIPVSKNFYVPSIMFADELHVQFGKDIVYNTFDQNRIFAGIKQNISKSLSFDFGYMMVFQQRANGYQYNRNHTLRCFFYYKPDFRKK